MKKTLSIILTILMIVTMIPFTPIAFAAEGDITYVDDLSYVEHPGGWDNDSEEALNGIFPIGTQDEGKTEWKNGDKVTVSLASDKYDAQSATLTYDGAVWTSSDTLSYLKNETPTVTAVYTSSDTLGLGEFIFTPECTLVDNALSINFEDAIRTHSRLRIATLAGLPLTVTVTGFTPAGAEEAGEYVYTLTADDNGNAYLYGIFAVGATVSVKNGNIELVNYTFTAEDYPNGTEQDKSYALQAGLIIDGTLGGKTTATEDDVNALVEKLKGYVDSGITTIIVTGSEPALHNFYDIDTPAVSAALYYLADNNYDSPYCGTIDLILPDVTEIVDDEFNNTFALNSITLPKVTKLGDLAFYACCFIQTIAFGSVVTDVEEGGGVMFAVVGQEVGGCDLILNCGQMNSSYIPDLDTNTWKFRYENEFKSITLTHTGGEATCIAKATCETCGEEYGEFDANKHTLVQKDAKAPTCTEIGWDAYESCTECDYTTYEVLPAITHIDANCDYKCDYNCGYEYETLDFSDAKVLSTNNGYLYIDGEKISVVYNTFNEPIQKIPGGKYILEGDMNSSGAYAHTLSDAVSINLNGYTWDFGKKYLSLYGALSIYDTSIGETGKMTSSFQRTIDLRDGSELNLYSGTVENNSENDYSYSLQALKGTANLYGGKLKSNKYAIDCNLRNPEIINLVGTVLESGEGYGQLRTPVTLYDDEIPEIVVDVSDYNGIDLTLQLDFYGYTDYVGKYILIKGVENAEEAEKYKIKINYPEDQPDVYVEEIGYDEATGEIYLYTATNAFTKQPSVENDYTVDFNNPDVSFQWCEVEEKNLGVYTAEEFSTLFTYEFKAGDILKVSTDSEIDFVVLEVGDEYLELENDSKTAMIKIDADETIEIFSSIIYSENSVDIEFSVIKETALEGETGKTLQNPECGKFYWCKATAGEKVYTSDIITVDHNIVQVDAKAPTCTEIGWEAYEYCTACTYTTYVELPADPDAHTPLEAVKENEVAPKCNVAGSYDLVVYCDDCGAELDRDTKTVDALKHSFTKYEVTEEAKCGVAGKEVAACDNGCGATDEKAIEALKHDIVIDEAVAPKCGETGLIQGEHCTRCDYKVEQEIVPALEHKDADGDYKCDNGCGHEFEKPAPEEPTPDTPDEPTDSTCDHLCHKSGILGFFWKIVKFFSKLFKLNPVCECGAAHY